MITRKIGFFSVLIAPAIILTLILQSNDASSKKKYKDYVKVIYSYESFRKSFGEITEPAGMTSRKNYELFLTIISKECKESFSFEEITKLAEFFESPLGKKYLKQTNESKAWGEFLSKFSLPEIWICPTHSEIRMPEQGNCSICKLKLVKQKYVETGADKSREE